jgi:hypothetical protein
VRNLPRLLVPPTARRNPVDASAHLFLPLLATAGFVSAAGVGARFGWRPWFLTLDALLATAAALRAGLAALERTRRRHVIDGWLLDGTAPVTVAAWRSCELASPRRRASLGRCLWRIEQRLRRQETLELRGTALPGPFPYNLGAIRRNRRLLQTLRERLEDSRRPISARGVLLVGRLLNDPQSPLHASLPADTLEAALAEILTEFDRPPDPATGKRG